MGQKAAEDVELQALGKHSHYRVEVSGCVYICTQFVAHFVGKQFNVIKVHK